MNPRADGIVQMPIYRANESTDKRHTQQILALPDANALSLSPEINKKRFKHFDLVSPSNSKAQGNLVIIRDTSMTYAFSDQNGKEKKEFILILYLHKICQLNCYP